MAGWLDRLGLFRNASRKSPVIDLGCGTGLFLELAGLAGRVVPLGAYAGVDASAGMLGLARRRWRDHTFLHEDMAAAPRHFGGRASGVVSLFGSISYVPRSAVADTVERLLAPGGRFILMAYQERFVASPDYLKPKDAFHRFYGRDDWRRLYRWAVDLRVMGFGYAVPRLGGLPASWLDRILGLEIGTLCRWAPARGDFWLVTGRSPGRLGCDSDFIRCMDERRDG